MGSKGFEPTILFYGFDRAEKTAQDEKSIFVQHFRKLSVRSKYDPRFFFDVKSR
jgi:hypothetical protein